MREQVQRLDKRPSVATQQGQLTTGVTGSVSMPYVQQQKTSGQRLAETLGMLVEGGTKIAGQIITNQKKEQDVIDSIEFRASAVEQSQKDIQEIEQLPVYEREKAYRAKLEQNINNLKQQYKNNAISSTGFTTYINTLTNQYEPYSKKSLSTMQALVKDKNESMVAQSLYDYGDYTQVPVDTISNEYGITKSAIAKTWLKGQIVKIQSKLTNNEIKPIEAFKELDTIHKSMATKENPNIWKNPEYVKEVNTAKASLITAITSNTTKQEKALKDMREEKEAIFKIALTEAKTQEEKDNIILKAKSEAEAGNIEWKNVLAVVDYSATKAVEKPSALQVSDVEYATLMYEARTNSDVTYSGVFDLHVSGIITADQAKELNTLVKEKQALLRTLENEGKAESYKKATKLISTVTKQGIAIDPTLKAVTDNLMLNFMDRITAGEDPYKVANELVTNEPTLTKSIDKGKTFLIKDNPKYYMFREFGLESIKGGNLEKKAIEIKKSNDLQQINNYKKALVTLHKNKSISYEDYRTAYMELNRGDN